MTARYWKPDLPRRDCAECGNSYKPNKRTQQFCGKSCSTRARAKAGAAVTHTARTCPHCSKVWSGPPSNPSRFCSKDCLKADWRNRRKRECAVCGAEFHVEKAGRAGVTCSDACLSKRQSEISSNRRASPETRAKMALASRAWRADPERRANWLESVAAAAKSWHSDPVNAAAFAKRSSERMKARHQDPEWQKVRDERSSRVMKGNWETYRDEWTAAAGERYERMAAEGSGLCSEESEARKRRAAKWILKQANAAMREETNYNEVYAEVQARIRAEQPFNGPEEDYFDYLKWLGHEVVTAPECREIAETFLSEAIGRFAAKWRAKRDAQWDGNPKGENGEAG